MNWAVLDTVHHFLQMHTPRTYPYPCKSVGLNAYIPESELWSLLDVKVYFDQLSFLFFTSWIAQSARFECDQVISPPCHHLDLEEPTHTEVF